MLQSTNQTTNLVLVERIEGSLWCGVPADHHGGHGGVQQVRFSQVTHSNLTISQREMSLVILLEK